MTTAAGRRLIDAAKEARAIARGDAEPASVHYGPDARRGRRNVRREPSSARVEHLRYDWFPIATKPQKERLARLLLEDRGLVTFCPTERKWRNRNRFDRARQNKQLIEYPWHPRLVFVGLTRPYPWHILAFCPVVSYVISTTQSEPRRMRHADVWRLMLLFGHGRFVRPEHQRWMRTGQEFGVRDRVRLLEGPLAELGVSLEVREITGNMAHVFGEFFGSHRGFDVPVAKLVRDE